MENDLEETTEMTLEELLAKVGLQDKAALFEQEQMDMESLVSVGLFSEFTRLYFSKNIHIFYHNLFMVNKLFVRTKFS